MTDHLVSATLTWERIEGRWSLRERHVADELSGLAERDALRGAQPRYERNEEHSGQKADEAKLSCGEPPSPRE